MLDDVKERSSHIEETTMDHIIEENMYVYGQDTIRNKFAHCIDGMKLIHRRIIWSIGTRDVFKKSVSDVADVMAKYHPHGDIAIYESMIRLIQPFNNAIPFVVGKGGMGTYDAQKAAAMRYTNSKSSAFSRDMFFTGVNEKTLHFIPSETGHGFEPKYFIPRLPTAFLFGNYGICLGFTSNIFTVNINDVCDLVYKYVDMRSKYGVLTTPQKRALTKHLIPDFSVHGLLRNKRQILAEYNKGNYEPAVRLDGIMEVSPNSIVLYTVPAGIKFENIKTNIFDAIVDNKHWLYQTQYFDGGGKDKEYAKFELTFKRSIDIFEILDDLKKFIKFSQSNKPINHMINLNDEMSRVTPFDMLSLWLQERHTSIMGNLKFAENKQITENRKLKALILVSGHRKEIIQIVNTGKSREDIIDKFMDKFKLSRFQAKVLANMRLHEITKKSREQLVSELENSIEKLKKMQEDYANIYEVIKSDTVYFKKEYGKATPRRTKFPEFMGHVQIGDNGIIQFWDEREMFHIINKKWNKSLRVNFYNKNDNICYHISKQGVYDNTNGVEFPKEMSGFEYITTATPIKNTVVLNDFKLSYVEGVKPGTTLDEVKTLTYVGDSCTTITEKGTVKMVPINSLANRKTIKAKGPKTTVIHVDRTVGDDVAIYYCNPDEPNVIRVSRVTNGNGTLKLIPNGKTNILGIHNVSDPLFIVIPEGIARRCQIKYIKIPNSVPFIDKQKHAMFNFNKPKSSSVKVKASQHKINKSVLVIN